MNGLKPNEIKAILRLYKRRFPAKGGYTNEQAQEIALISRTISRQIGILINRKGIVTLVIVGDNARIMIPNLSEIKRSEKLSAQRLLHTHLNESALSNEDITDMVVSRLDSISMLNVSKNGEPTTMQYAYLVSPETNQNGYLISDLLNWNNVDFDFVLSAQEIEEEFSRGAKRAVDGSIKDRAILISVNTKNKEEQELELDELTALAKTAGVKIVGRMIQRVNSTNSKLILGKGKLFELEVLALQKNANMFIFASELTPAQMRNLSTLTAQKILGRTELILDIFAQHASSREGKLQVEMAQLKYMLPRLVGQSSALSRLAGGIGGRGPGENKLEMDRRKIHTRIAFIKNELNKVKKHRLETRQKRLARNIPIVSIVGYTNAGKSTLLNALTKGDVLAEDKLFATLDPISRRLRLPMEQEIILTDTVGFIRALPKELMDAFQATLEELQEAHLLLHVIDASHPEMDKQVASVTQVLTNLGLDGIPTLKILNKSDMIEDIYKIYLQNIYHDAIFISANKKIGLYALVQKIEKELEKNNHSSMGEITMLVRGIDY